MLRLLKLFCLFILSACVVMPFANAKEESKEKPSLEPVTFQGAATEMDNLKMSAENMVKGREVLQKSTNAAIAKRDKNCPAADVRDKCKKLRSIADNKVRRLKEYEASMAAYTEQLKKIQSLYASAGHIELNDVQKAAPTPEAEAKSR